MTPLERLHALYDLTGHGIDDCTDEPFVDVREGIRELEAELHMEQMRVHDLRQDMEEGLDYLRVREQQLEIERARAEKAEAHFQMMQQQLDSSEARVAELEHAATAMCKMCGKRGIGWWDGNVPGPRCWDHAPTRTEVETRSWHPWKDEPAPATVGDETPCEGVQEREAD